MEIHAGFSYLRKDRSNPEKPSLRSRFAGALRRSGRAFFLHPAKGYGIIRKSIGNE